MSVQDVIKKSVLESGVFDNRCSGNAYGTCHSAAPWRSNLPSLFEIYVGVIFPEALQSHL